MITDKFASFYVSIQPLSETPNKLCRVTVVHEPTGTGVTVQHADEVQARHDAVQKVIHTVLENGEEL